MKPYSSYKDSGVEWIGEIPSKWGLSKLKYHTHITSSSVDKKYHEGFNKYPIIHYNDIVRNKKIGINDIVDSGYCSEQQFDSFKVMKGDLIVTKDSMDIKNVCDSSIIIDDLERCVFGYHLTKFSVMSSNVTPHYLFYFFNNSMIKKFYLTNSNGTTIIGVGKSIFENTPINLPPLPEQTQIVSFLDPKTQKIDQLIDLTKNKIELLKEQRIALINQCVTKGLNPNVEMKDSGVVWIGRIPRHWILSKIKYLKSSENYSLVDGPFGSNLKSVHYVEDGDVYIIESGFVTSGKFKYVRKFKMITAEHFETVKRSECSEGDIIIAKIGEYYGMCAILPKLEKRTVVSGNSITLSVSKKHNTNFIHQVILQHRINGTFKKEVQQTGQPFISLGVVNNLSIPTPPITEQINIMDYLNIQTQKIDSTIEKETQRIELLKEYRQSLISEVVTGKIDVRDEVIA
jgi:type I restriction enzyme, S subunit